MSFSLKFFVTYNRGLKSYITDEGIFFLDESINNIMFEFEIRL